MAEWVSGSGIVGYTDCVVLAVAPHSSSFDYSNVDAYRQGIEVKTHKDFALSLQPKIWTGLRDRFGNPTHILPQVCVGAAPSFTSFGNQIGLTDLQQFSTEEYIGLGNDYPKPIQLNGGPGYSEIAAIETLAIPFRKPSIEIPGKEHNSPKGIVPNSPSCFNTLSDNSSFAYLDQGHQLFGDSKDGAINIPGYVNPTTQTIKGYNDVEQQKSLFTNQISSTDQSFLNAINNFAISGWNEYRKLCYAGRDTYKTPSKTPTKADSISFALKNETSISGSSGTRSLSVFTQVARPKHLLASIYKKTSSDNRTGIYNLFYDDKTTPSIGLSHSVNLPTGLPVSSQWLSPEETTSLIDTRILTISAYDARAKIHNQLSQSIQPYKDNLDFAGANKSNQTSFFASGSDIPGFRQPLWNKTKIEIDLSVNEEVSWGQKNQTGEQDYYLTYYNHSTKRYDPIGSGIPSADYALAANAEYNFLNEAAIAFSPGIRDSAFDVELSTVGTLMSNFGFPTHSKYKVSKGSPQLYPLSNVLSEPFVLEKIVLEFTGSYSQNSLVGSPKQLDFAISTFFILNQKIGGYDPPITYTSKHTTNPALDIEVSRGTSQTRLEFVTKLQVALIDPSSSEITKQRAARELVIEGDLDNGWSGRFVVSGSCVAPGRNSGITDFELYDSTSTVQSYIADNPYGGRNGKLSPTGRNFLNVVPASEIDGTKVYGSHILYYNKQEYTVNPYILFPTDNLIFGWQIPFYPRVQTMFWPTGQDDGPKLTMATGPAKVILYGSHLKNSLDPEEKHDTLNQQLSGFVEERIVRR